MDVCRDIQPCYAGARVSLRRRAPTETGPVSANLVSTIQYLRACSHGATATATLPREHSHWHPFSNGCHACEHTHKKQCRLLVAQSLSHRVNRPLFIYTPANEASVYPQNSTPPPVSTIPSRTAPFPGSTAPPPWTPQPSPRFREVWKFETITMKRNDILKVVFTWYLVVLPCLREVVDEFKNLSRNSTGCFLLAHVPALVATLI